MRRSRVSWDPQPGLTSARIAPKAMIVGASGRLGGVARPTPAAPYDSQHLRYSDRPRSAARPQPGPPYTARADSPARDRLLSRRCLGRSARRSAGAPDQANAVLPGRPPAPNRSAHYRPAPCVHAVDHHQGGVIRPGNPRSRRRRSPAPAGSRRSVAAAKCGDTSSPQRRTRRCCKITLKPRSRATSSTPRVTRVKKGW